MLANYWSYKARHVVLPDDHNESRFIGMSLASVLQAWGMGIPMLVVVSSNPQAKYCVTVGVVVVTSLAMVLFMFCPKIHALKKERQRAQEERRRDLYSRFLQRAGGVGRTRDEEEEDNNNDDDDEGHGDNDGVGGNERVYGNPAEGGHDLGGARDGGRYELNPNDPGYYENQHRDGYKANADRPHYDDYEDDKMPQNDATGERTGLTMTTTTTTATTSTSRILTNASTEYHSSDTGPTTGVDNNSVLDRSGGGRSATDSRSGSSSAPSGSRDGSGGNRQDNNPLSGFSLASDH